MPDGRTVLENAKDTLGMDAFLLYPESRRLIPEAVLWGLAGACVGEFIKGFIDFKSLGETARAALNELLRKWRDKREFESYVVSSPPELLLLSALNTLPSMIPVESCQKALVDLTDSLECFGLDKAEAQNRATQIADVIVDMSSGKVRD
jgi:hypothetical protein